jgi:hypothetical protein
LERVKQGKYNKPHWLRYIRGHKPPGPTEEEEPGYRGADEWLRLLCCQEENPLYPSDSRMCGSQSRSGCSGEGVLTGAGSRRPVVQPIATLLAEESLHTVRNRRRFEICALAGYYIAFSGNYTPTFQLNLFKGQELLILEDGTDRLSRNDVKELPLYAA